MRKRGDGLKAVQQDLFAAPTDDRSSVGLNWSPQQQAFFQDVGSGRGHTLLRARAGTGKTTTILEAMQHISRGKVVLTAFNSHAADELGRRAPKGARVRTLHSLGYAALARRLGKVDVDTEKGYDIALEIVGMGGTREYAKALNRASSLAKGCLASTREEVEDLLDRFDFDVPDGTRSEMAGAVIAHMEVSKNRLDTIDYDDQIWLPYVLNAQPYPCDHLFIDEVQDMNPAQLELVFSSCPHGRIFAVGDDRQAIYVWRGADEQSMLKTQIRLQAKELPLTVTYRCPKRVVAHVKEFVPDFEAAPEAPEGEVRWGVRIEQLRRDAAPGDFILSRTNAPLLALCLGFLREGRRANIQGRDVGARLSSLVRKSKARAVKDLLIFVEHWRTQEAQRLALRGKSTAAIDDTAACIAAVADGARDVFEVQAMIARLFDEDGGDEARIVLSTTHRAKGLERARVWLLADTYLRGDSQEEVNLYYVAATRAKRSLMLVKGVK